MASSVACILGNAADGEAFSGQAHRLGMGSSATFVNQGSTPAVARSGIIPSGGSPLDVTALGTPAMKVNVKAGTCVVQSTSATGGCFTVALTAPADLDIATSDLTNPRIDLVVASVVADGTGAGTHCEIKVLTGTPAASPARPSISSPPANTHYFPLAQVRVEASASTIVGSKVTKLTGVDGVWTVAVGGVVPVSVYTQAANLPLYTPFYSINDLIHGFVTPAGVTCWGHMTRYWSGIVTTNGSGDCSINFGLKLANGFAAAPFPNELLSAVGTDAQAFGSTLAVIPRWTSDTSTAATATFRMLDSSGAPIPSTDFAFTMQAMGR